MQIRLLGPVDVVVRGEPRPVHGLRRKTVLAVLALHGGGVVSTGQLTDAVWGDAAPPTAVNSLHSHLSYLRGVLGTKTAILARPPGYVLQLPGPDHPPAPAVARRPPHPGRPAHSHPSTPVGADPPRTRDPRPDLRRAHQRGDLREAVDIRQDSRPPRFGHPRETARANPGRRPAPVAQVSGTTATTGARAASTSADPGSPPRA